MAPGVWRHAVRPRQEAEELERENAQLRRAVSDLTLDKVILTEAAGGTEGPRSETSEPERAGGWRSSVCEV